MVIDKNERKSQVSDRSGILKSFFKMLSLKLDFESLRKNKCLKCTCRFSYILVFCELSAELCDLHTGNLKHMSLFTLSSLIFIK